MGAHNGQLKQRCRYASQRVTLFEIDTIYNFVNEPVP